MAALRRHYEVECAVDQAEGLHELVDLRCDLGRRRDGLMIEIERDVSPIDLRLGMHLGVDLSAEDPCADYGDPQLIRLGDELLKYSGCEPDKIEIGAFVLGHDAGE